MYESAQQLSLKYNKDSGLNVLRLPNNSFGCTARFRFVETQQVSVALCIAGVKNSYDDTKHKEVENV